MKTAASILPKNCPQRAPGVPSRKREAYRQGKVYGPKLADPLNQQPAPAGTCTPIKIQYAPNLTYPELVESTALFGHMKGPYVGYIRRKGPSIEAEGGTSPSG